MPCEPLCPMISKNLHLKILLVKEKIATIRQIICIEIGIPPMTSPDQRSSQQQVLDQKLAEAVARLVKITEEIATGCVACRTD